MIELAGRCDSRGSFGFEFIVESTRQCGVSVLVTLFISDRLDGASDLEMIVFVARMHCRGTAVSLILFSVCQFCPSPRSVAGGTGLGILLEQLT